MMQLVEQTRDEKMAMYMKLTKRELAEMLVNANDALQSLALSQLCPIHVVTPSPPFETRPWPSLPAGTITYV